MLPSGKRPRVVRVLRALSVALAAAGVLLYVVSRFRPALRPLAELGGSTALLIAAIWAWCASAIVDFFLRGES